jgi:hypothetical protein
MRRLGRAVALLSKVTTYSRVSASCRSRGAVSCDLCCQQGWTEAQHTRSAAVVPC